MDQNFGIGEESLSLEAVTLSTQPHREKAFPVPPKHDKFTNTGQGRLLVEKSSFGRGTDPSPTDRPIQIIGRGPRTIVQQQLFRSRPWSFCENAKAQPLRAKLHQH